MRKRKGIAVEGSLLSVTQCAERHNVTPQAIHNAIERGAIKATKIGAYYAITEEDCSAYQPARTQGEKGARNRGVSKGGAKAEEELDT